MSFADMHQKVIGIARERVANGEITESQLARLTGVSQPHIHNVLKGVRMLSVELADEILQQLHVKPRDLLAENSPACALPFRPVPLLCGILGREMQTFQPQRTAGTAEVPARLVATLQHPLAARLGDDPGVSPRFESGDLILIDQAICARRDILKEAVYVVITSEGPRLRYVRLGAGRVYLASGESILCPSKWESVLVNESTLLLIVRARVVWVSRQLEAA